MSHGHDDLMLNDSQNLHFEQVVAQGHHRHHPGGWRRHRPLKRSSEPLNKKREVI